MVLLDFAVHPVLLDRRWWFSRPFPHTPPSIFQNIPQIPTFLQIYTIYDLDVLNYYDSKNRFDDKLRDEYNTELKRKVFKESQEYKDLLADIKQKKDKLFSTTYFTVWKEHLSDYDLKMKQFTIPISTNYGWDFEETRPPKTINNFTFLSLKTKKVYEGKRNYKEILEIPVDEKTAIQIEENRIRIYLVFKLKDKHVSKLKYYDRWEGLITRKNYITFSSNEVKIYIMNANTGQVYYSKNYQK